MQVSQKPLISFCMSTYKRPLMLEKQLKILLQQTYTYFEIIISDNDIDASGRDPVEVVGDNRIKYFVNDSNLGMVKSFNKSIERSSGDFIVMITDDDPAYSYMLQDLVDLTVQFPNYGIYAGCGDLIIENDFSENTVNKKIGTNSTLLKTMNENEILTVNANNLSSMYLDGFFSSTYLLWSCCLVRRDIILKIKGVPDYNSELLTDHAFVIAAGSINGMVYINKAMGGQTIHGGNFGYDFSKIIDKYIKTPVLFHDYLQTFLGKNPNWTIIEDKLWNFVGRGYVEYSLMIFKTLNTTNKSKIEFFKAFNEVFQNKNISKWKYKFYLKTYFNPLFQVLLFIKKGFKL